MDALYWSFFLVGCCIITPWNAYLSAVDYIEDIYPDREAIRWISLCNLTATFLIVAVNNLFPRKRKGQFRVTVSIILYILAVLSIPTIDWLLMKDNQGTQTTFVLLLVSATIVGIGCGVLEGTFTGLSIYLPDQYYQGYQTGFSFAGVLLVSLRAIMKAVLSQSPNGLRTSAFIFLFLTSLICAFTLFLHRLIIVPHPLCHCTASTDEDAYPLLDGDHPEMERLSIWKRLSNSPWYIASCEMKVACVIVFLNAALTLVTFPGIVSDVECDAVSDWYSIILVAIYNLSEIITKLTVTPWITTELWIVTLGLIMKTFLVPLTFIVVHYFSNPFLIAFFVFMNAASHGYFVLCGFGIGQKKMEGKSNSFFAGNTIALALLLGYTSGSYLSVAWTKLNAFN